MRTFLAGAIALAMTIGFAAQGKYTPKRTAWGDPDLQGTYTNKNEFNTPFERPAEFEGRRVEDVTGAELAAVLERRQALIMSRQVGVGPPQFRDPVDATRGSRAWSVIDPPDGRIPPLTPAAAQRIPPYEVTLAVLNSRPPSPSSFGSGPFDGPEDLNLYDRCITRGLPGSMQPFILGNSYQFVQTPGYVAIRYELLHDARVIPLDGRPHLSKGMRFEFGDARGHWEGNSLVVETTNFKDRSTYRAANATTLKLIERFTRTAPGRIEWTVTIDDPSTWTRPWTFAMPLTLDESEPVLEYACHEGNYAVPNILSAARAAEKSAK